ncbi:hypothetical protein [Kaistia terrae]|uniref:Uncharacterized protein n=1 Tax=Kaistia terrae TaxID=537017 RepID=A0ABW0PZW6_9HYPH|nr:hypothetical protein [Kaistia terrae]MCX5578882.1 hypothetical protein [Kaistia terrae]
MTFMTYSSPGSHLNGLAVSANDWVETKQVDAAAANASVFRNLRKFPPLAEAIHKDYGERQGARFLDWTVGLPPEADEWNVAGAKYLSIIFKQ